MKTTQTDPNSSHPSPYHSERITIDDGVLHVCEGPYQGHSLPLDRESLQVGRAPWCDLCLEEDLLVSKHHCELQLTSSGVRVRDLDSRNGIYLNDQRVFDALLAPRARLRVGHSVVELRLHKRRKELELPYYDNTLRLVGQSPAMRRIFGLLPKLASQEIPVLLLGETGTGKTTIARALHQQSPRHSQPFVAVNCGAFAPSLIESTLFGYEKGAFTGASKRHRGTFEQAHQGTLFLDEIGELPLSLQPRLLDVLERKALRRLGSEVEVKADFRLIAATHRDLRQEVQEGRFREDLYYRIAVMELTLPSLRQRPEDIPLLVKLLLAHQQPSRTVTLTTDALHRLQRELWPGNIRQLNNVLKRALALSEGPTLDVQDLHLDPLDPVPPLPSSPALSATTDLSLKERLQLTERSILEQCLQETRWNIPQAAERLQISKVWVYNRIKKYGLPNPFQPSKG